MTRRNIKEYQDILPLPHPVSTNRPHLSMQERAAQFSPFAALTGYDDAVKETALLNEEQMRLREAYFPDDTETL